MLNMMDTQGPAKTKTADAKSDEPGAGRGVRWRERLPRLPG